MEKQRRKRQRQRGLGQIFLRLLVCTGLAWLALLAVTLSLTLSKALSNLTDKIEGDLTATAASLAGSRVVQEAVTRGACPEVLSEYLDALVDQTQDLDIITIAGADLIRVYHVVPERIGEQFVGGDQGRALMGESYLSDGVGTMGLSLVREIVTRRGGSIEVDSEEGNGTAFTLIFDHKRGGTRT